MGISSWISSEGMELIFGTQLLIFYFKGMMEDDKDSKTDIFILHRW